MKNYTPAQWVIDLTQEIAGCTTDITNIVATGSHALSYQQRGYALLETLAQIGESLIQNIELLQAKLPKGEYESVQSELQVAVQNYLSKYNSYKEKLESLYDEHEMEMLIRAYLRPWERSYNQQREKVEQAEKLHELAKLAHDAMLNGSFLQRWRTLKAVRKAAGFKLERWRTGNFVARTYDLLHDAQKELQRAQNEMFAHNLAHKCNKLLYKKIAEELKDTFS